MFNHKDFTAAPAALLLNPKAELRELMKWTFADLLYYKVLALKDEMHTASKHDKRLRRYTFVMPGPAFNSRRTNLHERWFKNRLITNRTGRDRLRHFLREVYDDIPKDNTLRVEIQGLDIMEGLFRSNLFGAKVKLTDFGKRKQEELEKDLVHFAEKIKMNLGKITPEQHEILGSKVILLDDVMPLLCTQIDAILKSVGYSNSEPTSRFYAETDDYVGDVWDDFDFDFDGDWD